MLFRSISWAQPINKPDVFSNLSTRSLENLFIKRLDVVEVDSCDSENVINTIQTVSQVVDAAAFVSEEITQVHYSSPLLGYLVDVPVEENVIVEPSVINSLLNDMTICTITNTTLNTAALVSSNLQGRIITAMIDSGASVSCISAKFLASLAQHFDTHCNPHLILRQIMLQVRR